MASLLEAPLGRSAAISFALLVLSSACGGGESVTTDGGSVDGTSGSDASGVGCAVRETVRFKTDDDVELEADLHPSTLDGEPVPSGGVVLVHMIPPSNNRTNYREGFIDALTGRGLVVLNLDRRGAGNSEGTAAEAYEGPNGKLDLKAAISFLMQRCTIAPNRLGVVGASNGTTTAIDYAVFASQDETAPAPATMVLLTAGAYTENQTPLEAARPSLETIPILFVYSTQEREFSAQFEAGAPGTWSFEEYNPGAHGTRMLDTRPESVERVADFLKSAL